jgi:hypothetical protein
MAAYEKEQTTWHRRLLAQKEQQILSAWLHQLRAREDIQILQAAT